jgi:hypothetical protein
MRDNLNAFTRQLYSSDGTLG